MDRDLLYREAKREEMPEDLHIVIGEEAAAHREGHQRSLHPARNREEFFVLEGRLIESDGTILESGDWIVYEPGSDHHTRTDTGCLLLGLDWDPASARA